MFCLKLLLNIYILNILSKFCPVVDKFNCSGLAKNSCNADVVRGCVSPTVRGRGKCSWPNVHSPAPPSPTACTERVRGLYTYCKQADTYTQNIQTTTKKSAQRYDCKHNHTHTNKSSHRSGTCTWAHSIPACFPNTHWQYTPGSWRSLARYPRQPQLGVEGPAELQLSTLLSLESKEVKIVKEAHVPRLQSPISIFKRKDDIKHYTNDWLLANMLIMLQLPT